MSFWSKLGKGLAIGGAGLGTALSFGAAAPALAGVLGSVGLAGSTGAGVASGLGALGAGLGAASQGSANNRGEKFSGQLDLEKLLMERDAQFQNQQVQREQEGRAGTSDAWRKLLSTSHLLSPGSRPHLSPYSVPSRGVTGEEAQGAGDLMEQVLARLHAGNPIAAPQQRPLNVDPTLLDAGGFEKFAGIASPALGLLSKLKLGQPKASPWGAMNV
jgi:hypothetical protein